MGSIPIKACSKILFVHKSHVVSLGIQLTKSTTVLYCNSFITLFTKILPKKKKTNPQRKHFQAYSTGPIKLQESVQQLAQGLAPRERAGSVTDGAGGVAETGELKGPRQQQTEAQLSVARARADGSGSGCWIRFHPPSGKTIQRCLGSGSSVLITDDAGAPGCVPSGRCSLLGAVHIGVLRFKANGASSSEDSPLPPPRL